MLRTTIPITALSALLSIPALASAQADSDRSASAAHCAPTDDAGKYRLLRQLSLDIRGRIPTVDEYAQLEALEEPSEAIITEMLSSEDFFQTVRRYHRNLLWSNLDGVNRVVHPRRELRVRGGRWFSTSAARIYRGQGGVPCLNQEQQEFDADGRPIPIDTDFRGHPRCEAAGCRVEGWVWVNPYWDPSTRIRVCAYDAQTHAEGNRFSCGPEERRSIRDRGCGCGEGLRHCVARGGAGNEKAIRDALAEEPARLFEHIVREGRPYFEALTTDETVMDGKLAHFYRTLRNNGTSDDPAMASVPERPYDAASWAPVMRDEQHSGVLTTTSYLMRFASHRARINRFYSAFLCQPFDPPEEGLPPATDPCSSNPDLSERCGCANCHSTIEPAAAHFTRWQVNQRFGFLDSDSLPVEHDNCRSCTAGECSNFCNTYYVTPDNTSDAETLRVWRGYLLTRQFRSVEEARAIEEGPAALVQAPGREQTMARCTAQRLGQHLLGRELTPEEHTMWVPELARSFEESGYSFPALVREVVTDPRYRTIR